MLLLANRTLRTGLFLVLLGCTGLVNLCASERIIEFRSEVKIEPDGWLDVRETITVEAQGNQIRRGIYRDFPTIYTGKFGVRRTVDFEVVEILRNGVSEPWKENRKAVSNGVRIYVGDANRLVPHGLQIYTLHYKTNRQLYVGPDFDELYWNVTGQDWAFPIEKAVAQIQLPPGAGYLSAEAYTGRTGEKGTDWRLLSSSRNAPEIVTTRTLAPGEGFTVSVTWPKGYLDPSVHSESLSDMAADNLPVLGALGLLAAVLVYYLVVWILVGRDPPRGIVVAQYGPPKGFTPSAVRYVLGFGRVDEKSFTAAVLQLAVQGAIRIVQTGGKFTLARTDTAAELLPGQKKFLSTLLGGAEQVELVQTNHAQLQRARLELTKWLRSDFERGYFFRNSGYWLVGVLLSLLPAGLSMLGASEIGGALFMLFWLTFWTIGTSALLSAVFTKFRSGEIVGGLGLFLFSIPFVAGWFFGAFMLLQMTSLWMVAVFVTGSVLNLLFYHLLKAPTLEGRAVMDHIEGFRHYLAVAERDRLDLENPPERTPALFEKFLPYAVALDVEQRWAKQFTEILEAAAYQPAWFSGSDFSRVGSAGLAVTLGSTMSRAVASASTSPSSSSGSSGGSGSGGGGSSGGGGGGGGGGGW